jgi:hypothetical protein
MADKSQFLCSAGVIFYCRRTKLWLKVSITERSNAASNYQGELLGAVLALLILCAVSEGLGAPFPHILLHCNNRGVISHGNSLLMALSEKQHQVDLIRLTKLLSSSKNCKPQWEWVKGHAVERKGWSNCTLPERLNHQADKLAKCSLLSAINGGSTMEGDFPFEIVKVKLSGKSVSGSPWQALEADWGYRAARSLFDSKNIIHQEDFHLVWWDRLCATMSSYPKMYRVWLTKHVSDFCGNNVQLYYWSKGTHSPRCNFCTVEDKYTMHICQCRDPGHDPTFRISVSELCSLVIETLGNTDVASTIEMYLLARGTVTMSSCLHGNNTDLLTTTSVSDLLGWDSFIKGRIVTQWQTVATPFFSL